MSHGGSPVPSAETAIYTATLVRPNAAVACAAPPTAALSLCKRTPHNSAMELRHLRYFVAVAEELHFSRAAARLNIAAPTLSGQIQALETLLGARLFMRKTRSVALTHVGKRFLDEARATLKQADQAELVGRRAARGELGSIAVGYILSAACGGYIASAIDGFRKTHPNVSIEFRKMETFPQMNALVEGTLDVAFVRAPHRYPAELTGFVIGRQRLCLAIPSGHHLASVKAIGPAMLAQEPFVGSLLTMEVGFWDNISAVMPEGHTPHIVMRSSDIFTVLTSVALNMGLSVVSESLKQLALRGVVYRDIPWPHKHADHAVVFRKNEGAPVIKAFVAMLRATARKCQV
jgi:DNA-binding transcriptional LysR family regulator